MRDRPTWRLPTLRGVRELILRAPTSPRRTPGRARPARAPRRGAGWALDPLTRDVFRDVHAALEGVNPAEHRPTGSTRWSPASSWRSPTASRRAAHPALVAGGGVPGEDPEDPPEPGDPRRTRPTTTRGSSPCSGWRASTISGGRSGSTSRATRSGSTARASPRSTAAPSSRTCAWPSTGRARTTSSSSPGGAGNPVYSGGEGPQREVHLRGGREGLHHQRRRDAGGAGRPLPDGGRRVVVDGGGQGRLRPRGRSGAFAAKRLVYYVELPMAGLTTVATSLSTMTGEFASHGAEMVSAGRREMTHMPNVSTTDTATFQNNARTAYRASGASAKEPFVIAIAYTDHLAVKDAGQVVQKTGVTTSAPAPAAVSVPIVNAAGDSEVALEEPRARRGVVRLGVVPGRRGRRRGGHPGGVVHGGADQRQRAGQLLHGQRRSDRAPRGDGHDHPHGRLGQPHARRRVVRRQHRVHLHPRVVAQQDHRGRTR